MNKITLNGTAVLVDVERGVLRPERPDDGVALGIGYGSDIASEREAQRALRANMLAAIDGGYGQRDWRWEDHSGLAVWVS